MNIIAILCCIIYFFIDVKADIRSVCPDTHPVMELITHTSARHMEEGQYMVMACCPITYVPIFFGKEGVGCCKTRGQRCVFKCKCRDNTLPIASMVPVIRDSENCKNGRKQALLDGYVNSLREI